MRKAGGDEGNHSEIGNRVGVDLEGLALTLSTEGTDHALVLVRTGLVHVPDKFGVLEKNRIFPEQGI